uniref:Centrosomal protein of 131 kDa n=1 Tax=Clastoptera arizonana TaxID=38151 RepID=A0A1B6DY12_9HEMI
MPVAGTDLKSRRNKYSKILDLQLNGFQINLTSRPNSKSDKVIPKLSPRINKLRLKRPMSATPSIGYQGSEKSKLMPSWTRPQSAGSLRRSNKLATKFPDQNIQESGYNSELGATYTLSSSQILQSLMGSCSINAGLDSDSSHASTPQPSLGETIRAAAHLEPGLASKPPLPPSQDLKNKDNDNIDDIIAFKFQRWFPDSVMKHDSQTNISLDLKLYESKYNNDEITDESDIGSRLSLTDGETSDRDYLPYSNKYQRVKIKTPKNSPIKREGDKKSKANPQVNFSSKLNPIKSPIIVVTNEDKSRPDENIRHLKNDRLYSETSRDKLSRFGLGKTNSLDGIFYKSNTEDNMHLKPNDFAIHHSPPIKLKAESSTYQDHYSKISFLLEDSNRILNDESKENPQSGEQVKNCKVVESCAQDDVKDSSFGVNLDKVEEQNDSNNKIVDNFDNVGILTLNTSGPTDYNFKQNELKDESTILLMSNDQEKSLMNKYEESKAVRESSVSSLVRDSFHKNSIESLLKCVSENSDSKDKSSNETAGASYEDIVSILKVLETEDLEPPLLKTNHVPSSPAKFMPASSSTRAILKYLDEVDNSSSFEKFQPKNSSEAISAAVSSSKFAELLNMNAADLAQTVMKLMLQVEELTTSLESLKNKHQQTLQLMKQQKDQEDATIRRNQKFIDQILNEKRKLAEQCEKIVREMDEKHLNNIKSIEGRHKVELKKAQEKYAIAEKSRRDRWIDLKTKKIKELTVKGLEPELDRMSRVHQEEIAELRRVHQKQLEDADAAWSRRLASQREQDLADKEVALTHEREATRHRLEIEVGELEKSYQEQRKRLLEDVRKEREAMEKDVQHSFEQKQKEMDKEWQKMQQQMQVKMKEQEIQHQDEMKQLREAVDTEKESWMTRQKSELLEKESAIRQELKRERDRHIEMIIRKLENEATTKEQAIDNKIKRLKETYESEIQELDNSIKDLKQKLKEARCEVQKHEDDHTKTSTDLHQAQTECTKWKQMYDQLQEEKNIVKKQDDHKISCLQQELTSLAVSLEQEVASVHEEKERQLHQVYTRVKEAIAKKDEAVNIIQKQRDAALEQCAHLEKLLEQQRKSMLQIKTLK